MIRATGQLSNRQDDNVTLKIGTTFPQTTIGKDPIAIRDFAGDRGRRL